MRTLDLDVVLLCVLVSVHQCLGHVWIWESPNKQLWAAVHQLHQWEDAAVHQPAHLQAGASMFFIDKSHNKAIYRYIFEKCGWNLTLPVSMCCPCHINKTYIYASRLTCLCDLNTFQEDYVSEGLAWQNIGYSDNSGCIQLLSQESTGLLELLNAESKYVKVGS